ncbi:MAG: DUF5615 family PIN-like protein [Leptospiraceae bacterium]|nr:DUF5615 family PIN-like protein [Leptospiraceae bacterium]
MKFLIDANLPKRLSLWLKEKGYDSIHTLELPEKNLSVDNFINKFSISEQRIVISKDKDFVNSFLINKEPFKLVLIKSGNLSNPELIQIFENKFTTIVNLLEHSSFIEVHKEMILLHS